MTHRVVALNFDGVILELAIPSRVIADAVFDAGDQRRVRCIVIPNASSGDSGAALESTLAWIEDNVSRPLTIKTMAAHAQMSERNFARRFVAETGASPMQWLLQRRILIGRELLETSTLSIKQVAARAGFGSTMAFRDQFKRRIGSTPVAYRAACKPRENATEHATEHANERARTSAAA